MVVDIPACEARVIRVQAGERFRIIDVEGGQCVDFWAIAAGDVTEWLSADHTRTEVGRLFPVVGEHLYSNRRTPMLLFEEDNSPGLHSTQVATCDPVRYRNLGVEGWHPSCEENFLKAAAPLGWKYPFVPTSTSWFTNVPVDAEGRLGLEPALTKAGDSVVLKAEIDCDLIVCSCAQDILPINNFKPTPLAVELVDR
jgi:uncharacterized protein YcgI (DUF1989 family)